MAALPEAVLVGDLFMARESSFSDDLGDLPKAFIIWIMQGLEQHRCNEFRLWAGWKTASYRVKSVRRSPRSSLRNRCLGLRKGVSMFSAPSLLFPS